jgi:hypothetical protein
MVRPRSRRRAQVSIYETDLTEQQPELLAALTTRDAAKERLGEARHNFKVADDAAAPLIAKLELGEDAAVRVGDFVISQKMGKAGHVEFERRSSLRTRIRKLVE